MKPVEINSPQNRFKRQYESILVEEGLSHIFIQMDWISDRTYRTTPSEKEITKQLSPKAKFKILALRNKLLDRTI